MIKLLEIVHTYITNNRLLQLFTAATRVLLAVGFIPPSIPKIMHRPFTVLPDSNPVGHYFNALYHTGFYYEFIGWSQLIAAILLLIPRTSHIGALMFLPIIVNIAVLTTSVGFVGTWLVTILMAFAAAWLTAWEFDRLKPMFAMRAEYAKRSRTQFITMPALFAAGGIAAGVAFYSIRLGNFSNYLNVTFILIGMGAIFGLIVAMHLWWMPAGRLMSPNETKIGQ